MTHEKWKQNLHTKRVESRYVVVLKQLWQVKRLHAGQASPISLSAIAAEHELQVRSGAVMTEGSLSLELSISFSGKTSMSARISSFPGGAFWLTCHCPWVMISNK